MAPVPSSPGTGAPGSRGLRGALALGLAATGTGAAGPRRRTRRRLRERPRIRLHNNLSSVGVTGDDGHALNFHTAPIAAADLSRYLQEPIFDCTEVDEDSLRTYVRNDAIMPGVEIDLRQGD